MMELDQPPIDWPSLARGFGVPAERCDDAPSLARALARALVTPGPSLVEAVVG